MTIEPYPVVFEPIFKPKPWGGRRLAELFAKTPRGNDPIGESWELADLPGNESRVARGALSGKRVADLIKIWGSELLGAVKPIEGRFPLLIKFLDARQWLSLQVHPWNAGASVTGQPYPYKHEAWYVVDAEPHAEMYIGLKPGVTLDDLRQAGPTKELADLHQPREGKRGACYYLPSGVPHALGPGLVVAEIQTPADVTYRLYDWQRTGLDGRPRELHFEQALANVRCDIPERQIAQAPESLSGRWAESTRLVACNRFLINKVLLHARVTRCSSGGEMRVWIVLNGQITATSKRFEFDFGPGDVVLLPAAVKELDVAASAGCELLEVIALSPADSTC